MILNFHYSITIFLQGAALGLTAAATPGPFQTFIISETIKRGRYQSFTIAFAPLMTDLPIILISLFLLNQLTDNFLRIISICGGIFLLYLAWSSWREWRAGPVHINTLSSDTKWSKSLIQGMIMNFLSPGPYIFWMSVTGPILLSALRNSYLNAAVFLLGFYGVFIGSLISLVIMFDQTRRFGVRVVNTLLLMSIFILGIFGIILLRRGLIS